MSLLLGLALLFPLLPAVEGSATGRKLVTEPADARDRNVVRVRREAGASARPSLAPPADVLAASIETAEAGVPGGGFVLGWPPEDPAGGVHPRLIVHLALEHPSELPYRVEFRYSRELGPPRQLAPRDPSLEVDLADRGVVRIAAPGALETAEPEAAQAAEFASLPLCTSDADAELIARLSFPVLDADPSRPDLPFEARASDGQGGAAVEPCVLAAIYRGRSRTYGLGEEQ